MAKPDCLPSIHQEITSCNLDHSVPQPGNCQHNKGMAQNKPVSAHQASSVLTVMKDFTSFSKWRNSILLHKDQSTYCSLPTFTHPEATLKCSGYCGKLLTISDCYTAKALFSTTNANISFGAFVEWNLHSRIQLIRIKAYVYIVFNFYSKTFLHCLPFL